MPELSNLPIKTKYTPEDRVFVFDLTLRKILSVTISEWRVEVDNPLNDSTGRQIIYYKFEEVPYELQEKYVFASENHCLSYLKNDYINRAIESGSGGEGFFKSGVNGNGDAKSYGNWTDFAGFDMTSAKFIIENEWGVATGTVTIGSSSSAVVGTGTAFLTDYEVGGKFDVVGNIGLEPIGEDKTIGTITDDTHLTVTSNFSQAYTNRICMKPLPPIEVAVLESSGGENTLVFDNTKLLNAVLPDSISDPADNWQDFRDNVRSYDANTTIMPDGDPIGYP